MEELFKRISKKIDIIELSKEICKEYKFGEYKKHEFIFVGIDDLSYYLYTSKGKYVIKIIFIRLKIIKNYIKILALMDNS